MPEPMGEMHVASVSGIEEVQPSHAFGRATFLAAEGCRRHKNQKSKIKNQKSKIKNQKSKIKNQKSKIETRKLETQPENQGKGVRDQVPIPAP
jgi:hypothetical protein